MEKVFGYKRGIHAGSNKKYAEMLRRGLKKGLLKRMVTKRTNTKHTYEYYIPK